jgi:CHAT domain-containing protein
MGTERAIEDLITGDNAAGVEARLRQLGMQPDLALVENLRARVDHFVRIDLNQALKIADTAWQVAGLVGDPLAIALGARAQAQVWWAKGDYEKALQRFDQAEWIYRDLGMELEMARIYRSKIAVLMYLDRYAEALEIAKRARPIFEQHDEPVLLAQLNTNVGNVYRRMDQHAKALEFYDRARATFLAVGDKPAIALIDHNRANALSMLNRIDEAMALYEKVRDLFHECGMSLAAAQADYNRAYLKFIQRDYNGALKLFEEVKAFHLQAGNAVTAVLCDLDLLEIYIELNLFDTVIEMSEAVERKFKDLQMNYERAKVKTYRAIACLEQNDLTRATIELEQAKAIFTAEGNDVYSGVLELYLADLKLIEEDYAGATTLCERARETFARHKLPGKVSYAQLKMAKAKWRALSGKSVRPGDCPPVQDLCTEILDHLRKEENPWLAFQYHHLLGNIWESHYPYAAYGHYRRSIEYIDRMYSNIQPDEFRSSFLKDKLQVYEDLIALCLRDNHAWMKAEAFFYVERAKSRSLVELLARSHAIAAKVQRAQDSEIYRRWDQLRAELNWLYDRTNDHPSSGEQRAQEGEQRLQTEIRARERSLSELLRQLQLEDEEYSSLHTTASITVPDLQRCLREREALIEYYFAANELKIFVTSQHDFQVTSTPVRRDDIYPWLQRLQFQFEKFPYGHEYIEVYSHALRTATNACLEWLYHRLLDPVRPWIEDKDLIIVPHDVLHYIPFHALYDGQRFLIESHEVSYAPSASVFRLCQEKASRAAGRALIIGVPGAAIPSVEQEVRTISQLFPDNVLLIGPEGTKQALEQYAPDSFIIHLATHGFFRYDNPLFSAIRLADTWLNFHDIYNLDLRSDLVTLSGCYSGLNRIAHGDELLGLVRGFLYAGAASLLVSLWAVNDRSTAEFMQIFYSRLKEGASKRSALREATLEIKKRYEHPYYWAPFVLIGRR